MKHWLVMKFLNH